jgi:hypothetical protein
MTDRIVNNKLFQSKVIAEVHVNVIPGDDLDLNIILLKRNKNNLEIKHSCHFIRSFEDFTEEVPKNIPLSLIIDGKGIFQRQISKARNIPVLNQVLPNAAQGDFIIQEHPLANEQTYVVVARKDFIRLWVAQFTNRGYYVIDVSLGPCVLNNITSLLPEQDTEITVKNYNIKYCNRGILEITRNGIDEEVYRHFIEDEQLTSLDLIPFAGGVRFFKDTGESDRDLYGIFRDSKEQFVFRKIFRKAGMYLTALLFIVLLVNFLFYDHYNNAMSQLQKKYSVNKELIDKIEILEQKIKNQQLFLQRTGILGSTIFSYYADRLAYLLTGDISLTSMKINPVLMKIKSGEPINTDLKKIIIRGETDKSSSLNRYINEIEKEEWVSDVNLNSFKREQISEPGEFEIEAIIK